MPRTVWYPGHMAKGGRALAELLDKLDLVVEVRDARAPLATAAPLSASFSRTKPVLLVLSKRDLANPQATSLWLGALGDAWALDLRSKEGLAPLRRALLARKPPHRELRLAVMGIPNVGKSLLLNALAGKTQARVGGVPGVTRSVSWFRSDGLLIVDSPGILDPHAEPGVHLALSWLGCAKAEVLGGFEAGALALLRFLRDRNLMGLLNKWDLVDEGQGPAEMLDRVGRRLGCLGPGGVVDGERAGRRLLEAFALGKLGPVTLELPGDPITVGELNPMEVPS